MKKKFRITVNGVSYDVEVEEIPLQEVSPPDSIKPASLVPAPKTQVQKPKAVAPPPVAAGEYKVAAPISGKVTKVLKKVNEAVKEGEVLLLLEAMKMQNEIVSKKGGTVTFIIDEGTQVAFSDTIAIIK
ncbi:MAG: biotin/lipoyl-containing protein [Candidatus Hodarchaeota archaeon]